MKVILMCMLVLFQISCSKVLYVSVPCKVEIPIRPVLSSNTPDNIKKVLIYTELLENTLNVCVDRR